jgi:Na+-transporting methylmalonyl-CoA/oxaloacetate decarboxylase gamma subunit
MADTANEQRSPEEIRRDIEDTRGELGDTVEALAAKADVKAQAQERVDEVKQKVADVTPASVQQTAKQNPLPFVAGGALLVGFLLGRVSARG